ncbi:MAG: TAXI family TRAP transporter solute-binding subunit [Rhodospirillales bacterium]|nr:TAXI family TRAP transporter solute-binding subunit [Rhodospirillales bacterium]
MKTKTMGALCAALVISGAVAANAAEVKLPKNMAWTAYNTGTTGYNQSVAIGKALKDKYGVTLRVVPGKNDISRLTPVKAGKVDYSANGIATFFASEGVFQFADSNWGPMPVRVLLSASGSAGLSVAVAADKGIKTYADLKGKRVAYVRGGDALNVGIAGMLACGGLTYDDVEKVEFPGYGAAWEGMVNDQVDAMFASTLSGPTKKLEASPRGIYWPPTPHNDEKCWGGIKKTAPYFVPRMITKGTGISAEQPYEGPAYPYPILMTLAKQDKNEVYSLTRAIVEEYDNYSAAEPAAKGWALKNQLLDWVVPYHDGAIMYLKEAGVWTDAHQAHNDKLVERQGVLADAWSKMDMKLEGDAFASKWLEMRAAALSKAGFDPIWK